MRGEEKTSFSGTQVLLPRVGVHVLLCLTSRKVSEPLGPKQRQHHHHHHLIVSFYLKHAMKLGWNFLKEVASRSHFSDGQTPSFNTD